jgi:hypothetical protein
MRCAFLCFPTGLGQVLLSACVLLGCAAASDLDEDFEPFVQHDEPLDFEVDQDDTGKADGISPTVFDRNRIVEEAFFTNANAVDGNGVQAFFENTPYGTRSFLANERVGGRRAADVIVEKSREAGINPVMLVARMQVEKGLVSKTQRPSQNTVDFAFGCGCPDGHSCYESYRGLDKQIACAVDVLSRLYEGSVHGTGEWRQGKAKKTLDPLTVTPANHATASLYGYTPWVLPNRGGNWLVWNVTRIHSRHFQQLGLMQAPSASPWVGTSCETDGDCAFSHAGQSGFCFLDTAGQEEKGFCSLPCEGYCPDLAGRAKTFCTLLAPPSVGGCVSRAQTENGNCSTVPGTSPQQARRYVGSSGAPADSAAVCLPD